MKNLSKILIVTVCFSLAVAFCAYAEEMKAPEAVVVAPAVPPAPVEKTTLDNLQAAFNGESNAHARYLAFAQKADQEGYGKAASLFRAASRAEQVHFERHAKVIKELGGVPTANIETPVVKTTPENLKAAMEGEIYESTVMYPEFLAKADKDKITNAADAFEDAGKAETVHASLYKKALGDLKAWKGKNKKFSVCLFCGNVVEKLNFESCPICGESKKQFVGVK
ncbi:MAG: ferritin family protein [Candidatus Omnitrophica bacterium]|nr:ferritin family protein [Candidatus Omnitrophota bacterium]